MIKKDSQAEGGGLRTCAVVIMGVCGSGKTEIGRRLAEALDWTFLDADDFHPPACSIGRSGGRRFSSQRPT